MVNLLHIFRVERNLGKEEENNILTEFIKKIYVNLGVVFHNIKNEVDSWY